MQAKLKRVTPKKLGCMIVLIWLVNFFTLLFGGFWLVVFFSLLFGVSAQILDNITR